VARGDALERLYGAPFDDFVTLRKALAAELRAAGDLASSREILGARKPSRTAWAVNQVVRKSADVLRAAFEAFDAASRAQSSADADAMRETARVFRDRVSDVVAQCERLLADGGASLSTAQARRLTETIRATIAGGAPWRERVLSGRLTEDVEVDDPLAGFEAVVLGGAPQREHEREQDRHAVRERDRDRERKRERELEAQRAKEARDRAVEKARRDVAELEAEARDAREAANVAEVVASRAQAEAQRVRRDLDAVEERLARARTALRDL
jgi:hypothetical protein